MRKRLARSADARVGGRAVGRGRWTVAGAAMALSTLLSLAATSVPPVPAAATTQPSSAVGTWLRRHDVVFLGLQTDLRVISTADANGSTTAIVAACQQLSADLATMRRLPPIPERGVEQNWSGALGAFRQGAEDCVHGVVDDVPTLDRRSGGLLKTGVADVDKVLAALHARKG